MRSLSSERKMEAVENLIFSGKILRKELVSPATIEGEKNPFSIRRSEPVNHSCFEEKE